MANGFVASRPSSRHGDAYWNYTCGWDYAIASKFTAPGSGTLEVSEIGLWASTGGDPAMTTKMGIFGHDSVNNCPSAMISNSETGAFSVGGTNSYEIYYATYATKPQITGGVDYWLSALTDSSAHGAFISVNSTGGTTVSRNQTYPNWPTDTEWHTHTDRAYDQSYYAVYAAVPVPSFVPGIMSHKIIPPFLGGPQ